MNFFDLAPLRSTKISASDSWIQNGIVVAERNETNQCYGPYGICVDDDQTIYVADRGNHCILECKRGARNGQVVAGENERGEDNDQLGQPTDVIFDKENDYLIICDLSNRRVVKWSRQNSIDGEIIISDVDSWGLPMDNEGSLYISDYKKHEVRRWRPGDMNVVAGGNGQGNCLDQLDSVIIDQLDTVYVADSFNQRIVCWSKGATCGRIVINGTSDDDINLLEDPIGLSFDRPGNLYVSDFNNLQVQKFNIDLSLHS